jgi:flagellar hook-associated protein 3 FlgL
MRSFGLGDLATSYQTRLATNQIKLDIGRLSQELSSGLRADLKSATGADLSKYSGIRTALVSLEAYNFAAKDAARVTEAGQAALGNLQDLSSELGIGLIDAGNQATEPVLTIEAKTARGRFESVIGTLNTRIGDRAVFSGAAVDRPALASAETILTEIETAIAGLTSVSDIETAVEDWFDAAAGGFETSGYLGATDNLAPLTIGPGEKAEFDIRADSSEIRDLLKGYALASLVAEGTFDGDNEARAAMLSIAGQRILDADTAILAVRGTLGVTEERIANVTARNSAEILALQLAETQITEADPYTAATQLQAAETQLETLYAVTARLSRLSLVDYIR